jgi:hypothetical protein
MKDDNFDDLLFHNIFSSDPILPSDRYLDGNAITSVPYMGGLTRLKKLSVSLPLHVYFRRHDADQSPTTSLRMWLTTLSKVLAPCAT